MCYAPFLSTLPARGATVHFCPLLGHEFISIHAPREGSDQTKAPTGGWAADFYPRSPRGERPRSVISASFTALISIHAPREGSDIVVGV